MAMLKVPACACCECVQPSAWIPPEKRISHIPNNSLEGPEGSDHSVCSSLPSTLWVLVARATIGELVIGQIEASRLRPLAQSHVNQEGCRHDSPWILRILEHLRKKLNSTGLLLHSAKYRFEIQNWCCILPKALPTRLEGRLSWWLWHTKALWQLYDKNTGESKKRRQFFNPKTRPQCAQFRTGQPEYSP